MRIGILTFHRAHNYGAVLQCYALQNVLESLGYKSGVIDFRPDYIEENYKVFSLKRFVNSLQHPRSTVYYLKDIRERKNRKRLFSSFTKQYLNTIPYKNAIPNNIDCVLIGSDQLWSTNYTGGVIKEYFGEINHTPEQRIVGYAISANEKSLNGIGAIRLKEYVNNFSRLSFREQNIEDLVHQMTGKISEVCIDPVLLTTSGTWKNMMDETFKSAKYILVYQVHPSGGDFNNAVRFASHIAEQRGLKVVDMTDGHCSPSEFVARFKYAQYVVTTSFHGTVFSIIFHKEFVTLKVNETVDARAKNLLTQVGLIDRMIDCNEFLPQTSIDYQMVDSRLAVIREHSLNYLRNIENF